MLPAQTAQMPAQTCTYYPDLYLLPECLSEVVPVCPDVYEAAQAFAGAARGYRGEAADEKGLPVSGRATREC